ncbi:hypothetical protein AADZ90_007220 [Aestuariibius sp. 2305UL40-4]|uniref:hypothetical protein n=1 Tax=Aestuariibius violaceus TaxID=3234132 RepID=UPI00345EDC12
MAFLDIKLDKIDIGQAVNDTLAFASDLTEFAADGLQLAGTLTGNPQMTGLGNAIDLAASKFADLTGVGSTSSSPDALSLTEQMLSLGRDISG